MVVSKCAGMLSLEFCKTECFIYYAIEKRAHIGQCPNKEEMPE